MSQRTHIIDSSIMKELEHEYYDTDKKVADIIRDFNLHVSPSEFSNLLPRFESDQQCPYCKTVMTFKRTRQYQHRPSCPRCRHLASRDCACANCQAKKYEIAQKEKAAQILALNRKIEAFHKNWLDYDISQSIELSELSLRHKIYLGIVLSCPDISDKAEKYYILKPISRHLNRLLPTGNELQDVYQELIDNRILRFFKEPDNDQLQFVSDNANVISDYTVFPFLIHVADGSDLTWSQLIDGSIDLTEEEFTEWWQWIAIKQAESYLLYKTREAGFDYQVGVKTRQVLTETLQDFPMIQVKYLIAISVNHCAECISSKVSSDRYLAIQGLPSIIKFKANRAKNENWSIPCDRVPNHFTYAEMYLYERLLRIGFDGVTRPLSEAHLIYKATHGGLKDE